MIQQAFEASTITDALKMDADFSKEDPLLYATHFFKNNFANVSQFFPNTNFSSKIRNSTRTKTKKHSKLLGPKVPCWRTSGLKLFVLLYIKNIKYSFY